MRILFNIAGHKVLIDNRNDYRLSPLMPSFVPFVVTGADSDGERPAVTIVTDDRAEVSLDGYRDLGHFDSVGVVHGVYVNDAGEYIFSLNEADGVAGAYLTADSSFSHCVVSLRRMESREYDLRVALMLAYSMAVADKDTLLIHSSVAVNGGMGYMFLGKSGTGKSTHTRLWRENVPGTGLLNDDNPVIRFENGRVMVYGTPWSGKTPCYRQHSAPVGGIVLLRQAPFNSIRIPDSAAERMSYVFPSVTNMRWEKRVNHGILSTLEHVLQNTRIGVMDCLPDADAAWLSYTTLSRL